MWESVDFVWISTIADSQKTGGNEYLCIRIAKYKSISKFSQEIIVIKLDNWCSDTLH